MPPSKPLSVIAVPAFRDNYIWTIAGPRQSAVIDPGQAAPVLDAFKKRKLAISAILLTHKHDDHTGGVADLLKKANVPVYGPKNDAIASVTHPVSEGDTVTLPELGGLTLTVLELPGHTRGHIAYYSAEQKWLFCGDVLFGAGCGRIFEGTPDEMLASLKRIAALPDDVQLYPGHEYTISNLKFAREIEPENAAIAERSKADLTKRNRGRPTLPVTVAVEKATNPFLRSDVDAVMEKMISLGRLSGKDPAACFAALREWKNTYI